MLNIGDTVVYPSQGIGIISCIEEREFKGEKQIYYHIEIVNSTMKLILPVNRVEASNIRLVSNVEVIDDMLEGISRYTEPAESLQKSNKKERESTNNQKFKSGNFEDYLSIVCNLTQVKNSGNINANETQTLNSAKNFVVQEIGQSKGISVDVAKELLDGYLELCF